MVLILVQASEGVNVALVCNLTSYKIRQKAAGKKSSIEGAEERNNMQINALNPVFRLKVREVGGRSL